MKLVEHKTHKGMFYLQWPDGSMSDDFYNKSRAEWYAINIQRAIDYWSETLGVRSPTGAFK